MSCDIKICGFMNQSGNYEVVTDMLGSLVAYLHIGI